MIELDFVAVVLAVLAVWRVTHLLVAEDGPWNVFAHLRRAAAAIRLQRLVDCFYCASVWIAIPFALLIARDWRAIAMCIPAFSGGAIVLERLTARNDAAVWMEEEEKS
jgi:hypothetical protein